MQWTVRLETRTSAGEVTTTELVTFSRPGVVSTLAEVGLMLAETKVLLAKLQASMPATMDGQLPLPVPTVCPVTLEALLGVELATHSAP